VRVVREAAPYLGIGTSLAATVGLGAAAGYWADGHLGTRPWLFLAGAVAGVALGIWQFYWTVKK
jgi:F0F1-type ATP synthase assembly protein I